MFKHRDAFIETLRIGPDMRKRVFETLEERFAHDLGTGRESKILYNALHSAVRDVEVPGAVEEFEDRFCRLSIEPIAAQDPRARSRSDSRGLDSPARLDRSAVRNGGRYWCFGPGTQRSRRYGRGTAGQDQVAHLSYATNRINGGSTKTRRADTSNPGRSRPTVTLTRALPT